MEQEEWQYRLKAKSSATSGPDIKLAFPVLGVVGIDRDQAIDGRYRPNATRPKVESGASLSDAVCFCIAGARLMRSNVL